MTISRKLLLILAVLVTIVLAICTAVATYNQTKLLQRMFNEKVDMVSAQLGAASKGGLRWGQAKAIEKVYTDFIGSTEDHRLEALFAIKPDKSVLWEHNEDPEHPEFVKKYLAVADNDPAKQQSYLFNESDHVAVLERLTEGEGKEPSGYLITFWNDNHLTMHALRMAAYQGAAGIILIALCLLALTAVIRHILVDPVHNLVSMASKLAANLDANMTEAHATTTEMSANASATTQKTSVVLQNSTHTAANVQQVAAGAEELASSLVGVSHTVEETSNLVNTAIAQANQSREVIASLAAASQNISQVTNMISEIAEQTNLLALNASIEAARAGDAGRGFAVVADEIKKLASTTGQATADITRQAQQIAQTATSSSHALQTIADSVKRINEQTTVIRTAVNEQSSVTQDITRNMHEASTHVQEVDSQLADVSHAATSTGEMSDQLLGRIGTLKSDTDRIVAELKNFAKKI